MDTKLKKTSNFLSFLLFFVLCSSFLFATCLTLETLFSRSKESALYPQKMIEQSLTDISQLVQGTQLSQDIEEDIYYNVDYYVETQSNYLNSDNDSRVSYEQFLTKYTADRQELLSFVWQSGEVPTISYNGPKFLIDKEKIEQFMAKEAIEILQLYSQPDLSKLAFVVRSDLAYSTQLYYHFEDFQDNIEIIRICFYSSLILLVMNLAFLVFQYRQLRSFNEELAYVSGWVWVEAKLVASFILVLLGFSGLPRSLFCVVLFWLIYLFLNELHFLGWKLFNHTSLQSLLNSVQKNSGKYGYRRRWLFEFLLLIFIEVIIAFMLWTLLFLSSLRGYRILVILLLVIIGVLLILFYIKRMGSFIQDVSQICQQVENIRNGQFYQEIQVSEKSSLNSTQKNLELIQDGVSHQVQEQLKSEKLKIELITNVSHDLKTPITSLINYSDLLLKSDLQPEYAKDYVRIISQKSVRLKNLVQDLFEISKATSGNLQMDFQILEINDLLMQTVAELDEKIQDSDLEFKIEYLDTPGMIYGDGGRLYNVFDNLISNVIKYSLEKTRVYVKVVREEKEIHILFKNIANYELNFEPNSLTERFVRGDVSRSTEGSGLGLAIAETFVNLMHGTMEVSADGDLFKVELHFPEVIVEKKD